MSDSTTLAAAAAPQRRDDRPTGRRCARRTAASGSPIAGGAYWRGGARFRARPRRRGLRARRQAVGHRRQPAAALFGAARGAEPRRHRRAGLPGRDRHRARLRARPRRDLGRRRRGPGAGRQDPVAAGPAAAPASSSSTTTRAACATTTSRSLKSFEAVQAAGREFGAAHPGLCRGRDRRRARPTIWRCSPTPRAPPARPKGVMLIARQSAERGRGASPRPRTSAPSDEHLAYLPMAWIGNSLFSLALHLLVGFTCNFPEKPGDGAARPARAGADDRAWRRRASGRTC